MDYKEILNRIDYNEEKIRNIQKDLRELKSSINLDIIDIDNVNANILKILKSEKARIKLALKLTRFKKEAAKLLGFHERTMYRKLKEYNI